MSVENWIKYLQTEAVFEHPDEFEWFGPWDEHRRACRRCNALYFNVRKKMAKLSTPQIRLMKVSEIYKRLMAPKT